MPGCGKIAISGALPDWIFAVICTSNSFDWMKSSLIPWVLAQAFMSFWNAVDWSPENAYMICTVSLAVAGPVSSGAGSAPPPPRHPVSTRLLAARPAIKARLFLVITSVAPLQLRCERPD